MVSGVRPMSVHEQIIVAFISVRSAWKRYELRKNIGEAFKSIEIQEGTFEDDWENPIKHLGYIPDAFNVDTQNRVVHLLEVDGTSATNKRKLMRMTQLWCALDYHSWSMDLTSISVHTGAISFMNDDDFAKLSIKHCQNL
jgi:hypothetical protein